MSTRVEVVSAQCHCCEAAVQLVRSLAGPDDEIAVSNAVIDPEVLRARGVGR